MHTNKNILCVLTIILLHGITCYRPDCDLWCCNAKNDYKKKEQEKELCKIKCYARSRRSLDDDEEITGPKQLGGNTFGSHMGGDSFSHLGHPSPPPPPPLPSSLPSKNRHNKQERRDRKEKKLLECLNKCPSLELQTFGCSDQCCKIAEKIHSLRNGSTTYECNAKCCNGRYTTLRKLRDGMRSQNKRLMEDLVDCWRTGEECGDAGGTMLLFSNFTTICLRNGLTDLGIGSYFNREDECSHLHDFGVTVRGISYPKPTSIINNTNPYGLPGVPGLCNSIDGEVYDR
ncbi:CRPV-095 [Crowpox virus]|nr:CRPV-095 [Crowpox virus]